MDSVTAPARTRSPLLAPALAGAFGALAATGAALCIPGLRTMNHEFAEYFTIVAALGALLLGAWATSRSRGSPSERYARGLLFTVPLLVGCTALAFGVMFIANLLGPDCRFEVGALFFWITVPPTGLLAAVAGAALGVHGFRWRPLLALVLSMLLLTALHDALQAILGPRIVDFLIGEPLGFDQRRDMALSEVHVAQRLFVLACAGGLHLLAAWLFSLDPWRRPLRRATLSWAAFLVLAALTGGTRLGLGWSWGPVLRQLDAERQSEHFVVRYASTGQARLHVDALVRDAEWHRADLTSRWGIDPKKKIRVYLFDGEAQMAAFTGIGAPHAGLGCLSLNVGSLAGPTLRHELVHVLHAELDPDWRVILNRGLLEGLAQAYTEPYTVVPETHHPLAGALEADKLPPARKLLSIFGFYTINENNAYDASASFVGWLILTRGFDAFRDFQKDLDFERAYGTSVDDLGREWRAFLAALPLDAEAAVGAKDAFDESLSPSYKGRRCPKLGSRRLKAAQEADLRWDFGDWEGALTLYEGLLNRENKPRWRARAAACLKQLDRCEDSLSLLEQGLGREGLGRVERTRLLAARLDCLERLQAWEAIEELLETLEGLSTKASADRGMLRMAYAREDVREDLAGALDTDDTLTKRRILDRLVALHPEEPSLRYLLLTRAWPLPETRRAGRLRADQKESLILLLEQVDAVPEAADRLAGRLLALTDKAIREGDLDLGWRIAEKLSYTCSSAEKRHLASERLRRINWERGDGSYLSR